MSAVVRCPSERCWPVRDTGRLAFDGYFACRHCGTYHHRADMLEWLNQIAEDLREWSECVEALRQRVKGGTP